MLALYPDFLSTCLTLSVLASFLSWIAQRMLNTIQSTVCVTVFRGRAFVCYTKTDVIIRENELDGDCSTVAQYITMHYVRKVTRFYNPNCSYKYKPCGRPKLH